MVAERRPGERRVALVPDAVAKLIAEGLEVAVESGAGRYAFATDDAYRAAGAEVVDDVLPDSDVVLTVSPLTVEQAGRLRRGALTLGFLPAAAQADLLATCSANATCWPSRWSRCRASPARSRWTRCRRRPWSPATAPRSSPPSGCRGSSRCS